MRFLEQHHRGLQQVTFALVLIWDQLIHQEPKDTPLYFRELPLRNLEGGEVGRRVGILPPGKWKALLHDPVNDLLPPNRMTGRHRNSEKLSAVVPVRVSHGFHKLPAGRGLKLDDIPLP